MASLARVASGTNRVLGCLAAGLGLLALLALGTHASASTPAAADPVPPGDWAVRWQDNFDGQRIDPHKWTTWSASYSEGCRGNKPDHKLEYNLPRNLRVANGTLTIRAERERYTSPGGETYDWTSGLITTGDSCGHDPAGGAFVQQGDYIQVRTKLPGELGMWPAFWTWNAGGNEVDVFEYHPNNRSLLELTNHTPGGGGHYYDTGYDVSAGWHHIGAYLGADKVDWYLDGELMYSDPNGFASDGAYLIVDLAVVDGTYHPAPPAGVDSAVMRVDSVKVFERG
jgi:beta-glucanase (GH16 family)